MFVMSIYALKGSSENGQIDVGLLNREDRWYILYIITASTGKGNLGDSQFLKFKDSARTLVSRKILARSSCIL